MRCLNYDELIDHHFVEHLFAALIAVGVQENGAQPLFHSGPIIAAEENRD